MGLQIVIRPNVPPIHKTAVPPSKLYLGGPIATNLAHLHRKSRPAHAKPPTGILPTMHEPSPAQDTEPERSSRTYLIVVAILIVLGIAAFLVIRPNPGGGGTGPNGTTHSAPAPAKN
jgi:hypothetical protein